MEDQDLIKGAHNLIKASIFLSLSVIFMAVINTNPEFFSLGEDPDATESSTEEVDRNLIVDGIHVKTGLVEADGLFVVVGNCTNCHSAKLITQNRMTAERWNETIKWMQETQNLWDLGDNQKIIVDYLVTNYPPKKSGMRRANLTNIEWYEAED